MAWLNLTERYRVLKLYSVLVSHARLLAVTLSLSGLATLFGLLPPLITRTIIDQGILKGDAATVTLFALLMALTHLTSTIVSVFRSYFQTVLSGKVALDLRTRVFRKALDLGVEIYENVRVGDITIRIYGYVDRIQRFLVSSFETIILNTMQLVGMLFVVFSLNPGLSIIMLVPIPIYTWGLIKYQPRARMLFRKTWGKISRMSAYVTSLLNSILLVKLVGREKLEEQRFNTFAYEVYDANIEATKYGLRVFPWLNLLLALTSVAILYVGGLMVVRKELSLGTLTAFMAYMWQVYGPIRSITGLIPRLTEAEAAYEKIQEIMETKPSVTEAPDAVDVEVKGEIKAVDVWYEYTPGRPVLKGISFRVEPGEVVGIIGPNGAGKSTLARILVRLYEPLKGSIMLDGVDLRKVKLSSLRRKVVLVPQEPMLLAGSMAFNIAYGSEAVDPLSIMYAAWLCGAHRFIIELPLAYDSDVGEHGKMLSGGQKQLICLARAVLLRPRIMILDEATSNVHVDLEETIMKRLLGYLRDATIISISHRPTLNNFVERVVVVSDGRVTNEMPGGLASRPSRPRRLKILDAEDIQVTDRGAWLEAVVDRTVLRELRARLPFPLSYPQLLVLYRDPEDMIVIKDWTRFQPETKRALLRHLRREHGLKIATRMYSLTPEMRFAARVILEDEDGRRVEFSIPIRNLILINNSLIIVGPRELYVVDLSKIDRSTAWKAATMAISPETSFEGANPDLLVKELYALAETA